VPSFRGRRFRGVIRRAANQLIDDTVSRAATIKTPFGEKVDVSWTERYLRSVWIASFSFSAQ